MKFEGTVKNSTVILTEGAVIERLHRDNAIELDPFITHAGLIYNETGTKLLTNIYRQYIDIGLKYDFPMIGFQANTSSKSPEELDGLDYLDTTDAAEFAESMVSLHNQFGIQILGGCCGTDNRHIEEIAKHINNCYADREERV